MLQGWNEENSCCGDPGIAVLLVAVGLPSVSWFILM
jgi:hypothetical protein